MRNLPSCSNLVEQTFAGRGLVRHPLRKKLERHRLPQREVHRPVHLAHPAASQQIYDPVALRYNRPRQKPAFEEIRRGGDRPVAQSLFGFDHLGNAFLFQCLPRHESHMSGN